MTAMFLLVILGATSVRAPAGFAPLAIGLSLTLIYLISIPVTNTSVNPARSTGVAIFQGSWALGQLWAFWVAPFVGAALAGLIQRWLGTEELQLSRPRCDDRDLSDRKKRVFGAEDAKVARGDAGGLCVR